MANTVTEEQVNDILKRSTTNVQTLFDKVTVVTVQLPNGFVLSESAGAVSKENYSEEIGKQICMERIVNKVWELEGYVLQSKLGGNA